MWQIVVTTIGSLVISAGIVILFRTILHKKDETHTTIKILNMEISGGGATVTMIVGAILILVAHAWTLVDTASEISSPTSTAPTTTPTRRSMDSSSIEPGLPQPEVVRITSPANGQKVVGLEGVLVEGTASKADDRHLWIFDHADNDQYYLITSSPLAVIDGHWSFFDSQVGSATPEDDGHTFVLMVITANDSCKEELKQKKPNNEGDIVFSNLPNGCTPGPTVNVVKVAHS